MATSIKPNYDSFDDMAKELLNHHRKNHLKDYAFIILDNSRIPWSWYSEKMLHLLWWSVSGGVTGAACGHHVYFESDEDILGSLKRAYDNGHKYAFVTLNGMILVTTLTDRKTLIYDFFDWCESGNEWLRGHIIAHPNKNGYIHGQVFQINLIKWAENNFYNFLDLGSPEEYSRSKENYHDDYTPYWLTPKNCETIYN